MGGHPKNPNPTYMMYFGLYFSGKMKKKVFGQKKSTLLLKNHPKYAKIGVFDHFLNIIPKLIVIS